MKDSHPLQRAGYAMLFERSRIIGKVVLKYRLQTRKFVIKITNVTQALLSKMENGGVLWRDANCKKIKNERPAFDIWEKDISDSPPGCQGTAFHVTFDTKRSESLRRKARFLADERKTKIQRR
jgi:hypothetical protein